MSSQYLYYIEKHGKLRRANACGRLLSAEPVYCGYCGYSNVPLQVEKAVQRPFFADTAKSEAVVPVVLNRSSTSDLRAPTFSQNPNFPSTGFNVQSMLPQTLQDWSSPTNANFPSI